MPPFTVSTDDTGKIIELYAKCFWIQIDYLEESEFFGEFLRDIRKPSKNPK